MHRDECDQSNRPNHNRFGDPRRSPEKSAYL